MKRPNVPSNTGIFIEVRPESKARRAAAAGAGAIAGAVADAVSTVAAGPCMVDVSLLDLMREDSDFVRWFRGILLCVYAGLSFLRHHLRAARKQHASTTAA